MNSTIMKKVRLLFLLGALTALNGFLYGQQADADTTTAYCSGIRCIPQICEGHHGPYECCPATCYICNCGGSTE